MSGLANNSDKKNFFHFQRGETTRESFNFYVFSCVIVYATSLIIMKLCIIFPPPICSSELG
ncbi:hypothetical protein V6Z11_D10G182200 [Gossypium hirsutum]